MSRVDQIDPDGDLGPSKSELKRQMSERQKLAETLAGFSPESLKTVPIEDGLRGRNPQCESCGDNPTINDVLSFDYDDFC